MWQSSRENKYIYRVDSGHNQGKVNNETQVWITRKHKQEKLVTKENEQHNMHSIFIQHP